MEEITGYGRKVIQMAIEYAPNLLLAIAVIVVGFWIIRRISRFLDAALDRANFSKDIRPFLVSILDIALKIMLLFSVAGIVGIETASFVAVLAAAGFAIGLALQGSLGNFAAGIIVLIFKPYKVDDWIDVQDKFGKVESIQIFNTIIITPGQKTLIIPNGQVVESIVTNYSKKGFIRMELSVTMPYAESYPKVKDIILEQLKSIPKVLQEPAPELGIETYDSHNIILAVRPYVKPDDYWEVTFEAYEKIKHAFYDHNIKVAYSEGVEMGNIGE